MQETIPLIFIPYLFAIIATLIGVTWKNLNDKIKELEREINVFPIVDFKSDLAVLKTDIQWIKNNIQKQK